MSLREPFCDEAILSSPVIASLRDAQHVRGTSKTSNLPIPHPFPISKCEMGDREHVE
jgi:hypothetical protein